MKKMKWAGLLLIPTLALAACGDKEEKAVDTEKTKESYTVGVDITFPPFEYENEKGERVGIDIDIMNAIAKDQNFELKFEPMDFKSIIPAVQTKQVDIAIAGMSINEDRKKVVDFTEPYFEAGITLAVKEDDKKINEIKDLKGKKVAVKKGTVSAEYAESVKEEYRFETVTFDDSPSMFQDVKNGNSDALLEDYPVISYAIAQDKKMGLKVVGERLTGDNYGIAVLKGKNEELLKKLNDGLKNIKDNGEYEKILDTYLSDGE